MPLNLWVKCETGSAWFVNESFKPFLVNWSTDSLKWSHSKESFNHKSDISHSLMNFHKYTKFLLIIAWEWQWVTEIHLRQCFMSFISIQTSTLVIPKLAYIRINLYILGLNQGGDLKTCLLKLWKVQCFLLSLLKWTIKEFKKILIIMLIYSYYLFMFCA